jgi:ABC-type histidine transport system ATPase subunit
MMIELRNVRRGFGDVRVLNGVNLRLEKGFVYTLKGGNFSRNMIYQKVNTKWKRISFYLSSSKERLLECIVNKKIELELGGFKNE